MQVFQQATCVTVNLTGRLYLRQKTLTSLHLNCDRTPWAEFTIDRYNARLLSSKDFSSSLCPV